MISYILIIIVALVEAGALIGALFLVVGKSQGGLKGSLKKIEDELAEKSELCQKLIALYDQMVDLGSLRGLLTELSAAEESLKAERGRITITQAELETVETRLRELEEIERELEASGIETKEELNILKKKQGDLSGKNESLKKKISDSLSELEQLMSEIQFSAQAEEQILSMKSGLISTQGRTDVLLLQLEEGNDQYFILKRRYDALDIEYAQLYEKFAEAEESQAEE